MQPFRRAGDFAEKLPRWVGHGILEREERYGRDSGARVGFCGKPGNGHRAMSSGLRKRQSFVRVESEQLRAFSFFE